MKLYYSFANAIKGIIYTVKNERNFRIHIFMAISVIWFSLVFGVEKALLALFCMIFAVVMCAELFNTAIEILVDMDKQEYNIYIKQIKDICAGAVFVTAVFAVITACFAFWDKHGWSNILSYISIWYNDLLICVYLTISFVFIRGVKK